MVNIFILSTEVIIEHTFIGFIQNMVVQMCIYQKIQPRFD